MRIALITAAAVSMFPVAAIGQDKKPADPDKKICRSETPTGSYFVKRVCHTAAEWKALENRDGDNVNAMRQAGLGQPGGAGPR